MYKYIYFQKRNVKLSVLKSVTLNGHSINKFSFLSSCSGMNELVDKFNTAYDRHTRRGGRTAFM